MTVRIHLIVARARNGVIGNRGAIPWHLPEDLAYFKRTTMGHAIVMGRKTWDSIGRPLPGRRNIVVTRNPRWQAPGAEAASSLDDAIARCATQAATGPGATPDAKRAPPPEVFIIGGAELYDQALARHVDTIHLTQIDTDFEGDTVFPALDPLRWRERARTHFEPTGTRAFAFDFVRYEAVPKQDPQSNPGDPDAK